MPIMYLPIVYSADNKTYFPLPVGALLDPQVIPLSALDPENILAAQADGITARPVDMVSADAENILQLGTDRKLFARAPAAQVPGDMVAPIPDNRLKLANGLLYVPPEQAADAGLVSVEEYNLLRYGNDRKVYINADDILSSEAGNMLGVSGVDRRLFATMPSAASLLSTESDQLLGQDALGKLLLTPDMLAGVGGIEDAPVDGQGYLRKNGVWLPIANNLVINPGDKILSQSSVGLLGTIGMRTDTSTGDLVLTGKGGVELTRVAIASNFIKDAYTEENPAGQPQGIYLVFVFDTPAGDKTVYIDVSSLIKTYTPADASIIVDGFTLRAGLDPASGLVVNANGIGWGVGYQPFTTSEQTKLFGIAAGATRVTTPADINAATAAQGAKADAALPRAEYTAADVLAKTKTVDGPGSGLDADLLDGQHAAAFATAAQGAAGASALQPTGNASNTTVTFTEATTRENIQSGSTLAVLFGQVRKWFTDTKAAAFLGVATRVVTRLYTDTATVVTPDTLGYSKRMVLDGTAPDLNTFFGDNTKTNLIGFNSATAAMNTPELAQGFVETRNHDGGARGSQVWHGTANDMLAWRKCSSTGVVGHWNPIGFVYSTLEHLGLSNADMSTTDLNANLVKIFGAMAVGSRFLFVTPDNTNIIQSINNYFGLTGVSSYTIDMSKAYATVNPPHPVYITMNAAGNTTPRTWYMNIDNKLSPWIELIGRNVDNNIVVPNAGTMNISSIIRHDNEENITRYGWCVQQAGLNTSGSVTFTGSVSYYNGTFLQQDPLVNQYRLKFEQRLSVQGISKAMSGNKNFFINPPADGTLIEFLSGTVPATNPEAYRYNAEYGFYLPIHHTLIYVMSIPAGTGKFYYLSYTTVDPNDVAGDLPPNAIFIAEHEVTSGQVPCVRLGTGGVVYQTSSLSRGTGVSQRAGSAAPHSRRITPNEAELHADVVCANAVTAGGAILSVVTPDAPVFNTSLIGFVDNTPTRFNINASNRGISCASNIPAGANVYLSGNYPIR